MKKLFALIIVPCLIFAGGLKDAIDKGELIQTHHGAIPVLFITPTNHKTKLLYDITISDGQAILVVAAPNKLPSGKVYLGVTTAISKDIEVVDENTLQVRVRPSDML